MKIIKFYSILFIALVAFSNPASTKNANSGQTAAEPPVIIANIKPLQSLLQSVVGDFTDVKLVLDAKQSPHNYTLKPSQARLLFNADLIFIVDEEFETAFKPIWETIKHEENGSKKVISATDAVTLLARRTLNNFTYDSHDDENHEEEHDHDEHESEEHAHEEEHDHDEHDSEAHDHDEHGHDHANQSHNYHIWLDAKNAIALVKYYTKLLSAEYPMQSDNFNNNAVATIENLNRLHQAINNEMQNHVDLKFLVFHDAYAYFEKQYGLSASGSITLDPEHSPSAKRISKLREIINQEKIQCVFSEPQFPKAILNTVMNQANVKTAILDPLGMNIQSGKTAYEYIMLNISASIANCLNDN